MLWNDTCLEFLFDIVKRSVRLSDQMVGEQKIYMERVKHQANYARYLEQQMDTLLKMTGYNNKEDNK